MPTSKLVGLAPLVLAGCVGLGGSSEAPREVQVTADQVVITGPRGFCVDPSSTRADGDTGFVILGNCAAISGNARAAQPDVPAVLTAAISARSEGAQVTENLGALEQFLRSEDGRRLLSRSGEAESVEILETRVVGGILFIHARDTSAGALAGVAPDYWRAYLDVGPRLATLSILALSEGGVTDADALAVLSAFADAVARANRGGAAAAPQGGTQPTNGPFTEGLLGRIFR